MTGYRGKAGSLQRIDRPQRVGQLQKVGRLHTRKKNVSPSSATSRDVFRTVEASTTGYRVGVATEELHY